ncbi:MULTISPECIES: response regulator [Sphingomonas]|uniref:response regulator n=1 Tax=Sphingomonas TaxID=13687 RepID=UPI000DEF6D81|nr:MULTISPECIES: response regulator [Sphingomonas]
MIVSDANREAVGLPKRTLLLVEDEILVRIFIAEILRDEGFEVLEAATSEEALRQFRAHPRISLVVSDVKMPGPIDGVQLSFAIKALEPHKPLILVSADFDLGTPHSADVFLPKPFQPAELIFLIKQAISAK